MPNALNVTTPISLGSGVITADGAPSNVVGVRVWDTEQIDIFVDVTAVSGTSPTLRVNIETSDAVDLDSASEDDWYYIQSFRLVNQVGRYKITVKEGLCRYLRLYFNLGGTSPSFTLSANMNSHQNYN